MSVDKLNWTENEQTDRQTFFCHFFRDKLSLLRSSYLSLLASTRNNISVAACNLTIARHETVPLVPFACLLCTPRGTSMAFVLLRRFLLLFIPKNKITAEQTLRFLSKTGVRNGKYRNPEDSGRNMQPSHVSTILSLSY